MPKSLFKSSNTSELVTVDLTGNHVKMVYAKKDGENTVFEDFREQKFTEGTDTEICQFLASTYKQWNIKNKHALCIIPSKLFISKNVDMPSNDPEEISKIIDLQAGRYTPYSREEIVIDYLCMTSPGQHYTNVLLIIVNRKLIDRYVKIFEQSGIFLDRMAISSEAMAAHYRKYMPTSEINGSYAGIHVDADFSDLTIVDKQEMSFVRSIPVGASHFQNSPDTAREQFVSELNKSITAYQDQGVGQAVKALLITGLTAGLETLDESIREKIPLMQDPGYPIKLISYNKQFKYAPDVGERFNAQTNTSFFELMSSATSEADFKIDLMPQEIKLKRKFREGGREIITMGILIMTCLVMICIFLASKIYIKNNLIDNLDAAAETVGHQARTLERASTKSRVLRNLIEYRGKELYIFEKITGLVGDTVYLSKLSYDQDGNIHMLGTAESMSGVFDFVSKMEDSGFFASVVTNSTSTRKEAGQEVADFDIEGVLIEEI